MTDIPAIIRQLEESLQEVEDQLANEPEPSGLRRRQLNILHELLFMYSGKSNYHYNHRVAVAQAANHTKDWNYYDDY